MLDNQTIEGLYALKLNAMATGLIDQRATQYQALSFEERLACSSTKSSPSGTTGTRIAT